MAHTIRMKREGPEPRSADVHPDEVENFRAAGFAVEKQPDPFDRDNDGKPGGSLPKKATAPRKRSRSKRGK